MSVARSALAVLDLRFWENCSIWAISLSTRGKPWFNCCKKVKRVGRGESESEETERGHGIEGGKTRSG